MAIGYCDPDGTVLSQWHADASPHHEQVDDAVRQPPLPPWTNRIYYQDGDESDQDRFNMEGLDIQGGIASSVTVWMAFETNNISHDPRVNLYLGAWQGELVVNLTQTGLKWYSKTYNGAFTQSHITNMQVDMKAPSLINTTEMGKCYEIYCVVTYTAGGYGHDFNGVPAANIASVSGVPAVNIANIKGVV